MCLVSLLCHRFWLPLWRKNTYLFPHTRQITKCPTVFLWKSVLMHTNTETLIGLVHHYYQDNVFLSEVQLDIFCHEDLHDCIYCFYPKMYLPLLKVWWVLRLYKLIRSACFDLCFAAFILFETQFIPWHTDSWIHIQRHRHTHVEMLAHKHMHNHSCSTESGTFPEITLNLFSY